MLKSINYCLRRKIFGKMLTKKIEVDDGQFLDNVSISKAEIEREKMILYFLIKKYDDIGDKIISKIQLDDFKIEKYKNIYNKILEITNTGNNIYNSLTNIEDIDFQANLSEIILSEYEINSVDKFISDIINNYEKNKLNFRKIDILKKLETSDLSKDEIAKLEKELSNIIVKLAKMR